MSIIDEIDAASRRLAERTNRARPELQVDVDRLTSATTDAEVRLLLRMVVDRGWTAQDVEEHVALMGRASATERSDAA